jgi:PAS domain S-box-containing protein
MHSTTEHSQKTLRMPSEGNIRGEEGAKTPSLQNVFAHWFVLLNKLLSSALLLLVPVFLLGIVALWPHSRQAGIAALVVAAFSTAAFLYRFMRILTRIREFARQEIGLPLERLLHTIELVSVQKLELLPEERRESFTSDAQQQLIHVARGILEHQRFVDQVVDNMFEMMFLLSADGVVMKANRSACETTRYLEQELVGHHFRKLFPLSDALVDSFLELEIQFATTGVVRDMEAHLQTSDGEILSFSLNGVKVESSSGDLLGYTVIAKNQSETVRLVNQLNRSNLELGRANADLSKRYDQIKNEIAATEGQRRTMELELATSQLVQKTFLPQTSPRHEKVEVHGTAVPAAFCGGDWWNTISLPDRFYVFIGDVTGHGTASAMVTAAVSGYYVSVKQALESGVDLDVHEILAGFDSVLASMASGNTSYYMTCFACVFDFRRKVLRYANAGHNFPLLLRSGQRVEPLVAGGERLGSKGCEPFQVHEVPLMGDEFVFFYTDGLIENKNEDDEPYGKRRLRRYLESNVHKPCTELVDELLKDVSKFFGEGKSLEDDVTFVACRTRAF